VLSITKIRSEEIEKYWQLTLFIPTNIDSEEYATFSGLSKLDLDRIKMLIKFKADCKQKIFNFEILI